jgi:hypothetical protein
LILFRLSLRWLLNPRWLGPAGRRSERTIDHRATGLVFRLGDPFEELILRHGHWS